MSNPIGLLRQGQPPRTRLRYPAPPSVPTRDQLRAELVGKTDDEVVARLGHARRIDVGDPTHPVWTYRRATRDPATGHYDRRTYIDFEHNIAIGVRTDP